MVINFSFRICLFACYKFNYYCDYYFNRGSAAVSLLRNGFVVKNKACREPAISIIPHFQLSFSSALSPHH